MWDEKNNHLFCHSFIWCYYPYQLYATSTFFKSILFWLNMALRLVVKIWAESLMLSANVCFDNNKLLSWVMNCILIEIGSRSASDDDGGVAAVVAAASFKWQHLMHLFDLNISTCFVRSCVQTRVYGHQSRHTMRMRMYVQAHATNVPCVTFIFVFFHSLFHSYAAPRMKWDKNVITPDDR